MAQFHKGILIGTLIVQGEKRFQNLQRCGR